MHVFATCDVESIIEEISFAKSSPAEESAVADAPACGGGGALRGLACTVDEDEG